MTRNSAALSASLRLHILGSFRLEGDSKTISLPTRKVESLLAYLALFPEQHTREKLAALLWGDVPDAQARHSLRTALAAIRKELGEDILIADRETVQLDPNAGILVDALEFEQAAESQDPIIHLLSAIGIYHDLLPDFYDDWVVRDRERLRSIYLDALLRLIQHHREKSEYPQAVDLAQKLLGVERANEKAHEHLMVCFAAQGDRIGALKQYDECKKLLHDDLNVEPSSETTELRDQITQELTGAPSRDAALTNLPNPLTSFVGRELEQKELKELIGKTRLLTLTGAGGCGKTRLAIHVGREAADAKRYKNGVWWVDLAPLSDPSLVPQTIATVFDLRETPDTPLLKLLTNFLREKELLLVLDNCEHLIDACARLGETLLSACSKLHLLTTSREALNVTGEVVWRVPSLAIPDAEHLPPLDQLTQYDAIGLFVQRAVAIAPNWKLNGNARAVAQICTRLDGIPLAIELAAARLKALSAEQIAARLDDRFQLLTSGSRTAVPRQQTLHATIDWSYDLLSEQERAFLRRLSVFAGGWTLEATEAVCSDDGIEKKGVIDLLTKLLDKSLVMAEEQAGLPRYRLLETIRQYAREKLHETGEGDSIRNRHLDFFLKFAEGAEPKLRGHEQFEWLDRLDIEYDNMRAALEWSLSEGRVERGLRLASALMWFWDYREYGREGRERVERLLNQPQAAPRTLTRANALLVAAQMADEVGEVRIGRQYLKELVAIAREQGGAGERVLALGLGLLGEREFGDDPTVAESMLEEGLAIARSLGDEWVLALLLRCRGRLFMGRNDHRAERKAYEESLTRFKSLGDMHWAAIVSFQISRIYFIEGEYARARRELEEDLPFFRETKDRGMVWWTSNVLGEILRAEGRYDLAKEYYGEMLELARELGSKSVIRTATVNVGYCALYDGDLDSARSHFVDSLTLARELDHKPSVAFALLGFAGLAAAEKLATRAVQLLAVVDTVFKGGDRRFVNPADEAEFMRHRAIACEQLDERAFDVAWSEGKALTLDTAVEYALGEVKSV